MIRRWLIATCPHCGDHWGPLDIQDTTVYSCEYCGKEGAAVFMRVVPDDQAVETLREWLAASAALKAVDTSDGKAIRATLDRVDAAKAAARAIVSEKAA